MTAAQPASPPGVERRVAHRRQPAMGTICRLDHPGNGKPAIGLLWNISTSGVSMLLHDPCDPGSSLVGILETLTGNHTLPVTGQVIHLKQLETGDYFVGVHFSRALGEDELKPFVS